MSKTDEKLLHKRHTKIIHFAYNISITSTCLCKNDKVSMSKNG